MYGKIKLEYDNREPEYIFINCEFFRDDEWDEDLQTAIDNRQDIDSDHLINYEIEDMYDRYHIITGDVSELIQHLKAYNYKPTLVGKDDIYLLPVDSAYIKAILNERGYNYRVNNGIVHTNQQLEIEP